MTETSLVLQTGAPSSHAVDAPSAARAPDRMVYLYVMRIYERRPDRLEPQYRERASAYAVSMLEDRDARVLDCVLDEFSTRVGREGVVRHKVFAVDPETGRQFQNDLHAPWGTLVGSFKDVMKLMQAFSNGAREITTEESYEQSAEAGGKKHPFRFDPTVRTVHLRAEIPGITESEFLEKEYSSVLGLWAIILPVDTPVDKLAGAAEEAFFTHVNFENLCGLVITVTDPATGTVLRSDTQCKWYEASNYSRGLYMLERFQYPSADSDGDAVV